MTPALDEFIEEARGVSIEEAAKRLGLTFSGKRFEHAQPCPVCGGTDTFSFNTQKNAWNCRTGGVGGRDAIGLAAHVRDLDIRRREGFLQACAEVTGRDIPEGGERETPEAKAARLARLEKLKLQHYEDMAREEADRNAWRDREREKARGIYDGSQALCMSTMPWGRLYLERRGCGFSDDRWLRVRDEVPYWHRTDERGSPVAIHSGPAMVAPFIDAAGDIIGCHITWIDLSRPPKFRLRLFDPETGEVLPSKKMRGSKKGGIIPIAGDPFTARRWCGGEGIENGAAFGRWEGFRADTFYFAAGDLGNLSGPADPASRFPHPTLTKPDRMGRERPVMIAGPVPKPDQDAYDAMWVADQVEELVLLADGDSERVMTAAAMARARARHARPGRLIPVVWPSRGYDFSEMMRAGDGAPASERSEA